MRRLRRVAYRATGGIIDLRSDGDLIADYNKRLAQERTLRGVSADERSDTHDGDKDRPRR
jgi:hypothetical protein